MHISWICKPHPKPPGRRGHSLPVLAETVWAQAAFENDLFNTLHHPARIAATSRTLKTGSTGEEQSAAVPPVFYNQTGSKSY